MSCHGTSELDSGIVFIRHATLEHLANIHLCHMGFDVQPTSMHLCIMGTVHAREKGERERDIYIFLLHQQGIFKVSIFLSTV